MKTTNRKTAPSQAANSETNKGADTIGVDRSDRTCVVCVLDVLGEVVESEKIKLERFELKALARKYPGCRVVIECGMHSPWVSRWLTKHGMDVVVANPESAHFHKIALEEVPADEHDVITPCVEVLALLTKKIKEYDKRIAEAAAAHPVALRLQQIVGIGPVTSLYYVLKIEDPERFGKVRDIASYLGLCPKRDQSGGSDKQLRISKAGDSYLRRLLVSAAQYLPGFFGKDCALRRFGLKLCERGGPRAKKKAVVAVARKLAVLMASLWKSGAGYDPQRGCEELGAPSP